MQEELGGTEIEMWSCGYTLCIHRVTLTDAKNEGTGNHWHPPQDYTFITRPSAIIYKGVVSLQKKYELCKVTFKNYI